MKFELGGAHWSVLSSCASVSGSTFYRLFQRINLLL